jgi:MoxR-like ATPase
MVVATQNPVEHEGTYPLPESQLDRFLMRVSVGYPSRSAEVGILDSHGRADLLDAIGPVATIKDVLAMSEAAREVHVAPSLQEYLVDLAETTRRHPALALGMSPRATLALQRASRARAAAAGRSFVVPDDIKALAEPVLSHRLALTPDAAMQGVAAGRSWPTCCATCRCRAVGPRGPGSGAHPERLAGGGRLGGAGRHRTPVRDLRAAPGGGRRLRARHRIGRERPPGQAAARGGARAAPSPPPRRCSQPGGAAGDQPSAATDAAPDAAGPRG